MELYTSADKRHLYVYNIDLQLWVFNMQDTGQHSFRYIFKYKKFILRKN